MRTPRVPIIDYAWPSLDMERGMLEPAGSEIVRAEWGDVEELTMHEPGVDATLRAGNRFPQ